MKISQAVRQELVRRVLAFVCDAVGFGLVAWVTCRGIDRSVKIDFPPHQAARAAGRMVPALLFLYAGWFVLPTVVWQATLGKKLLGLRVVRFGDAEPLGLFEVVIRETVAKWVSFSMNGAGFIDGLLTGRAFHDRVVGSAVIFEDELDVAHDPWPEVPWPAIAAVAGGTGVLWWSLRTNGVLYHLLWNGAFYVPHEAGHLIVGAIFPHLVGVAAGAFGQLLFPSVAVVVFARQQWPVQLAGALVWLGLSLLDIGQYAGDAWYRELALPVAAGDSLTEDTLESHDWWQMLTAVRLLRYAQPIGECISALGWVSVGLALGLLVVLARRPHGGST
jgi:uncharacterized RDD family membrane protein YckC